MKKLFSFLALLALLVGVETPVFAQVPPKWSTPSVPPILNAVVATTVSTPFDTSVSTSVLLHVFSASTSVATVLFRQSIDGTHWYTSVTVTNPTSAGELWLCPAARKADFDVSAYTSGTLSGVAVLRTMTGDPIDRCKKIDTSP